MGAEWRRFCRGKGLKEVDASGDQLEVSFEDHRRHRVRVADDAGFYRLSGIVVRKSQMAEPDFVRRDAWLRNRTTTLVGFRIDERDRLVGEAWVPKAGLTAEESQLYVRTLAAECDRFEFALTGRDVE